MKIEQVGLNPMYELCHVLIEEENSELKRIEGRLLTMAEAIAKDETQREAIKSFVRQAVWAGINNVLEILYQFSKKYNGVKIVELSDTHRIRDAENYFPSMS